MIDGFAISERQVYVKYIYITNTQAHQEKTPQHHLLSYPFPRRTQYTPRPRQLPIPVGELSQSRGWGMNTEIRDTQKGKLKLVLRSCHFPHSIGKQAFSPSEVTSST